MASSWSYLVVMASLLRVDQRWAVTGTPVPGLVGTNVGIDSATTSLSSTEELSAMSDNNSRNRTSLAGDLSRLGRIVNDFFRLEPWHSNPSWWQRYCAGPFLDGKRHDIIERILQQIMVRHRSIDLKETLRCHLCITK